MMHKMTKVVIQGRNPYLQENIQLTHLAMSEGVPKSYEEVRESIDWKTGVIFFGESLATIHVRLEEMAAPVVERTELLEARQRGACVSKVTERKCKQSCRQRGSTRPSFSRYT